jgi:O-antigen ligase
LGFLGEVDTLKAGQAGISRVGGTIGHANKLAIFLGVLLHVNMASFFIRFHFSERYKKYLSMMRTSSFVLMLATLMISYSRSGWAAFLFAGAINGSWCLARRTGKKISSVLIVYGTFFFFAAMVFTLSASVRNRILLDDRGAGDVRKPLAQVARNVIYHKPWLGIGLNNYVACYPEYDNTRFWVNYNFPEPVHNEFLLIAAETGIPAFLLFLAILGQMFFFLWRTSCAKNDQVIPYLAIGFFCGLIGWCIHNQKETLYVFLTPYFWQYFGIIIVMKLLVENPDLNRNQR